MGLWSALRLSRAAASLDPVPRARLASPWADRDHLYAVVWADLFGVNLYPVTRAEAMSVAPFARCRHVVCTAGRVPLAAVDGAGTRIPRQPMIVRQPDPREPRQVTVTWTLDDLLWHGVAWWRVLSRYAPAVEGALGFPQHAERLDPTRVDVDELGQVTIDGLPVDDPDAELIRFDGPHEGLLSFASRTIRNGARIERAAARRADNPVPLVEVHNTGADLTDEEIDEALDVWSAQRIAENGGVGYTNAAVELRVHGTPASELITSERVQVAVDAARFAGLPASSIDAPVTGGTVLSYDNPESRLRDLLDFGVSAYTSSIEARLSMDDVLPRGVSAAFDVAAVARSGWAAASYEPDEDTPAPAASTPSAPAPAVTS